MSEPQAPKGHEIVSSSGDSSLFKASKGVLEGAQVLQRLLVEDGALADVFKPTRLMSLSRRSRVAM